jgi:hypothetical protein
MANRLDAFQSSRRIQRSSTSVNPSGRRGYIVRTPFSDRQVKGFSSQTQIWEDSCNRPDNMVFRPGAILDKASCAEEVQPFRRRSTLSGRSGLNEEIACSRSATVRTLGQHRLNAALFRKEYQANLESRLHSCPSGRPQLPSGCRLGKSYQTRFRSSIAYK